MTDAIGWASSAILLATLVKQVYTQWKSGTSEGVSKWFYIGEVGAAVGFIWYSWLLRNWVFVATNAAILINTFVGLYIVYHHKRRERRGGATEARPDRRASGSASTRRA